MNLEIVGHFLLKCFIVAYYLKCENIVLNRSYDLKNKETNK